jgi:hypothetical protein
LKRDKKKTNGNVPIFCRITVDGKEVRFGMKKDICPNCWNVKTGKVTGRTNEAVEINTLIDDTRTAIFQIYRDIQKNENSVTVEKVKNVFLGIDCRQQQQNLLELFDQHNSERKLLVGKSVAASIYDKYRISRNHLADFLKERYNLTDIPLKKIDHKFICDFEIFMLTSCKCAENTTAKYMQIFKHIIIVGMKYGWIYKNPFSEYSIHVKKTDIGYLTQDEVEILMKQKFESKGLERVRDILI